MADSKEQLKSMLQNFIKDNNTEAEMDFHNFLSDKMKAVSNFKETEKKTEED
jgi:hypothetical protein